MKLVGATNWFIRWPFVIEGIIVGAVGAVAARSSCSASPSSRCSIRWPATGPDRGAAHDRVRVAAARAGRRRRRGLGARFGPVACAASCGSRRVRWPRLGHPTTLRTVFAKQPRSPWRSWLAALGVVVLLLVGVWFGGHPSWLPRAAAQRLRLEDRERAAGSDDDGPDLQGLLPAGRHAASWSTTGLEAAVASLRRPVFALLPAGAVPLVQARDQPAGVGIGVSGRRPSRFTAGSRSRRCSRARPPPRRAAARRRDHGRRQARRCGQDRHQGRS